MGIPLTRRGFAGVVGTAAAGLWVGSIPCGGIAQAAGRRPKPAGALPLNNNENPFGPNPKAIEAAVRACQTAAHRYPDAIVDEAQRVIADSHGVKPEQVVLGCGSSEILQMADQAFLWPGKKAVVAETTFEAVLLYARAISGVAVKVPLTPDFRHDLPAMSAACDTATGLAYVCNPNNPTATIVTGDELAAFAAKVPPHVTILVDEAYHHFVEDPRYRSAASLVAAHPNVVVVRTFSKIHGMAGLRLGYAVGSEERIDAMSSFASFSNTNVAVLAAGLASLADTEHLVRTRKLLNDNRRWLVAELARQGRRVMPSEANFVMVDLGTDVAPVIEAFRARKILVGRKFPSLATWLRVTVGKREELAAFAAALAEIVPVKVAA